MKLLTPCVYLVLFLTVSADPFRTVTNNEKATINEGILAAKNLTNTLQTSNSIGTLLGKITRSIVPWIDGFEIFTKVLDFFSPMEDELLEEIRKGFMEINKRLDEIKEGLTEVKKAIDWSVVNVNFQGIEQDIRLLDTKLDEVLQAPNEEQGKEEYIRVYEGQYNEAGSLLWDSIVNNDQVFYENIITAGMKYTSYRWDKMTKFMYGLIALIIKSSIIEIAYENFKEHDRDITVIWKTRLNQTIEAVLKADQVLENVWKDLFCGEVDKISKDNQNIEHAYFRNAVYSFLSDKYPWRYWWVLVYDDVRGFEKHAIQYVLEIGHHRFRHYGRNFMVGSVDPLIFFDNQRAKFEIRNRICPHSKNVCKRSSAKYALELTPFMGVAKAAMVTTDYAAIGTKMVAGTMRLERLNGTWSRNHFMFYFG